MWRVRFLAKILVPSFQNSLMSHPLQMLPSSRGFLTNQPSQFAATVYLEFDRSAVKRHLGELPAMMDVLRGVRRSVLI